MARIRMVCSEPNPIRWIGFLGVAERKEGCCMAAAKGREGILMVYLVLLADSSGKVKMHRKKGIP